MAQTARRAESDQEMAPLPHDRLYLLNLVIKQFLGLFWNSFMACFTQDVKRSYAFSNLVQLIGLYNSTFVSTCCAVLNCENKQQLARLKNVRIFFLD